MVVPCFVRRRILFQSVLYGTAQGDVCVDDTVGFGHDFSVNAARLMVAGCPVVFHGFPHDCHLFFVEPLQKVAVGGYDFSRNKVMRGAVAAKPCVVIGCYGVDKAFVCLGIKLGKSEAFVNDCLYMRTVVCLVEVFVSGIISVST